ncbi:MAG: hypothetical protein ACFNTU_07685, partial [Catonella sp.]
AMDIKLKTEQDIAEKENALAIKNAKKRMKKFDELKNKPSQFDPGTTVYKLVEELKRYLDE